MAQQEGNRRVTGAVSRKRFEHIVDLERLLDATLSGFGVASALSADNPELTFDPFEADGPG